MSRRGHPGARESAVAEPDDSADPDSPAGRGGASAVVPAGAPGTGRAGLDRRRVLGAAIEFIDQQGLDALTMRRLGAHLGVEAMALYRYVPGRENLLDGVVESVIDELYGDPDVHLAASHGWQDRSEEHTSELQSRQYLVCRLLLEKKNIITTNTRII